MRNGVWSGNGGSRVEHVHSSENYIPHPLRLLSSRLHSLFVNQLLWLSIWALTVLWCPQYASVQIYSHPCLHYLTEVLHLQRVLCAPYAFWSDDSSFKHIVQRIQTSKKWNSFSFTNPHPWEAWEMEYWQWYGEHTQSENLHNRLYPVTACLLEVIDKSERFRLIFTYDQVKSKLSVSMQQGSYCKGCYVEHSIMECDSRSDGWCW